MSKKEFIDKLTGALNGRVAPSVVTDNINYYEDYINMEIRKGRSEAEVLQMLGDPRLLAKTIIATNEKKNKNVYEEANSNYGYRNANAGWQNQEETERPIKSYRLPGWLVTVIVILIIVLILSAVFSVLSFLAPLILPIFVVLFLVKLFRDWLN